MERNNKVEEEKKCDYPGCNEPATIQCGMIGCNHRVCEIHGNCAIEDTPDSAIEICWGCGGKGWGDD